MCEMCGDSENWCEGVSVMVGQRDEMWDGFLEYVEQCDEYFTRTTAKRRLIIDCNLDLLSVKAQRAIRASKAIYVQDLTQKRLTALQGVGNVTAIEIMSWVKWQLSMKVSND